MGPSEETWRALDRPESWRGLSSGDRVVLGAWLTMPGMRVDELHTDVAVGEISSELRAVAGDIPESQLEAMYALRIDALVAENGGRFLVECKAYGNAHALGQVLTYGSLLRRHGGPWAVARACVCCCGIDDGLRRVYEGFGIRIVVVGNVLAV